MIPEELSPEMMREAEAEFRQVVDWFYPVRRNRKMTKAEFEKEYRRISQEQFVTLALEPLLPLRDTVDRSMLVVTLSDAMGRRRYRVKLGDVKVTVPRNLQRIFDGFDRKVADVLLPLLDETLADDKSTEEERGPVPVDPSSVRRLLLEAAFLRLFTAIEVFLQDTLMQALGKQARMEAFSRNVRDEDIPTKWPDGTKIRAVDYAFRWNEVVLSMLRFPYHEFEGRVSHRFKACFGFDLKSFKGLKRLVYFRNMRNRLVHRGSVRLGLPLVEVSRDHVLELARLAYQLAGYIERNKPKDMAQTAG